MCIRDSYTDTALTNAVVLGTDYAADASGELTLYVVPNADFNGTTTFQYAAKDDAGLVDATAATGTITVDPVNDAPVVQDMTFSGPDGTPLLIVISGSDADNLLSGFQIDSLPQNGTLRVDGGGILGTGSFVQATGNSANLIFDPAPGFSGSTTFEFRARDVSGVFSAPAVSTININLVNDDPVATDDDFATTEGGTFTIDAVNELLNNDSDIDGDVLTVLSVTQPTNGTVTFDANGLFTYTHNNSETTSDSFTYTVDDGNGGTDTATVNITITPVNDAPTTTPIVLTAIAEDTGFRVITQDELLANANDTEGDTLSVNGLTIASGNGTIVPNPDGSFTFSPDLNDDSDVTLSYTITDGLSLIHI